TRFSRDWSSDVCSSDLGTAEAAHPLGDVAGLPLGVLAAVPVEQAGMATGAFAQRLERHPLAGADFRPGAVAEHEEVEVLKPAGGLQGLINRLQARHDPVRVL